MDVAVVAVGHVRMRVAQLHMNMTMAVWLARRLIATVHMLVVNIVRVPVDVLERFMLVLMLMPFRQMQPDADGHENACGT